MLRRNMSSIAKIFFNFVTDEIQAFKKLPFIDVR
jgi:hypothetical protein